MAGLMLSVLIAAGALLVDQQREPTAAPSSPPAHPSPARAAESLHAWVQALAAPSATSARSLAPDGDVQAADLLVSIAENAQAMGLTDISARYVDRVGTVRGDGAWSASAALTWRVDGFHARPTHTEVVVRFAPDGQRVGIVGFGGVAPDRRRTPLWLQEKLSVVRTPQVLVAVAGDPAQARRVASQVRHGIPLVSEAFPDWEPAVVVQVPSTSAALAEALGREPETYVEVAAVTATDDGSVDMQAPTSIYLNPEGDAEGRGDSQMVMNHEIAHLATGAVTWQGPVWLLEGFADELALGDTTLPDTVLLRQAIALVRREGVPSRLPGRDAFAMSAPEMGAAYEMAWLACRIIVEHEGLGGLVALHERVGSGTPLPAALREIGLPLHRLIEQWRTRLSDLAG